MADRGVARCVAGLLVLCCLSALGAAQPTEVDALSIIVVLKCLPATFLSFGLNEIPLDQETSGVASTGPASGAIIAKLPPAPSSIMKATLAEDAAQIRHSDHANPMWLQDRLTIPGRVQDPSRSPAAGLKQSNCHT
ncbi:hypothetical protein WJX84_005526 [Apatococcus fuscideae]|uniref:Uncharacterized protein n=1 Tax=Apatococcus fuscideae TaxID=2026836 RepID=A0AAW1SZU7_9CHLO